MLVKIDDDLYIDPSKVEAIFSSGDNCTEILFDSKERLIIKISMDEITANLDLKAD